MITSARIRLQFNAYNHRVSRWLLIVLLPLAACYAPKYGDCSVACGNADCPVGLSCVDGFCRASNADLGTRCIDAPPGDSDNDTITDDKDNCPTVENTDQANEDKDEFGDVCDPCPPFPDADNNDTDGDKVGNGCDPNPEMIGDSIVMFEGFNELPSDALIVGNWTFIDGQARVSDSTLDMSVSDVVWMRTVSANESVLARIKISNLAGASAAAGIVSQLSATNGFSCVAGVDSGSNPKLMLRNRLNTIVDSSAAMDITVDPYLLDERRIGQEYRCNASAITMTRAMYTSTMAPATTAQFGLRAYDASAQYDWVMIVASP
jgi:hypothetical protein